MKRCISLGSLLTVLVLAVIFTTVPGCPEKKATPPPPKADDGKGGDGKGGDGKGADTKGGKGEALAVKAWDGVVKGKVELLDGKPPVMGELKMTGHADEAKCHAGPHDDQTWIVSPKGGVANVAVILEAPEGKFFAVDEKLVKEYKSPSIDQPYCVYEPQVVGLFAEYKGPDGKVAETGLKMLVKNTGAIGHNTKIKGELKKNPGFGKNIDPGVKDGDPYDIKYQKSPIEISCDKHTWMSATLLTFDHPFFAITDKDGNFEIKNVPTGVELTVKVWHKVGTAASQKKTFTKGDNDLPLKIKAAS
jgi:hypothetical protein